MSTAQENATIAQQQKIIDKQRELLKLALEGFKILERELAVAQRANPSDVPFGMAAEYSDTWHQANAGAYQHALEVCGANTIKDAVAVL